MHERTHVYYVLQMVFRYITLKNIKLSVQWLHKNGGKKTTVIVLCIVTKVVTGTKKRHRVLAL